MKEIKAEHDALKNVQRKRPGRKRKRPPEPSRRDFPFLLRNLFAPICDEHLVEVTYFSQEGEKKIYKSEATSDGKCPFCGFKADSGKGIKTHCFRFHSDQFQLKIVETPIGSICIQAEPRQREREQQLGDKPGVHVVRRRAKLSAKPLRCGVYFGRRRAKHSANPQRWYRRHCGVYFVRRRAKHSANPQCCYRRHIPRETMHQDMENIKANIETPPSNPPPLAAAEAPRPKRPYYHSRSRLPMHPHQFHTDSDDESNTWLDDWGEAGISQFSDLTVAEKKFCNLWNRFSRPVTVIADTDTYIKFLEFIRLNIDSLKGLRLQLLKHVMTFWEHKRLSRDQMLACMMEYDKLQKQNTSDK